MARNSISLPRAAKHGLGRNFATGLLCPLPVLKARKRLAALAPGDPLHMHADDPAAVIDVPHFCAEAGYVLTGSRPEDGAELYIITKGG
ncbi:sulfurtransferase TusA family protein [Sulfitobacter sp. S0837]|uniref:sulfurtransferase TusA family protein n=1 Tax=Sulfitobacter maritimus TaxID=2741719 RepID=UPI0015833F23|nr:sulfurtransferase TusA family protein [Sulfitobacter maritimus]NUH64339.1 sulfurtransferase TusA family protein [Sulfitobacter maritimus]